jgi:LacI family transcriptional regulator, gluconate utilization system Gnt-I transcriptional repressor
MQVTRKPRTRTSGMTVTLADVAREGGVSQITVSRVIRNKGAISEGMRERVEQAIQRVGYVPNRLAGSLASAGSDLIGVIVPSLRSIIFHHVLRGVNEAISAAGYRSVVGTTEFRRDEEERLVTSLLSWRPAAMIIASFDHLESTALLLRTSKVKLVEITDTDRKPVGVALGFSHWRAGYDTGRYLIERGYRRFGFLAQDLYGDAYAARRYEGFREALRAVGLSIAGERITMEQRDSTLDGKAALGGLLAEYPKLDAVYFSHDEMAVGGYFHCLHAGIDVPGRLAIAGFNGIDLGQALPQPLTTVLSDRYQLGRLAGQAALALINGKEVAPSIDVGFTLIRGATA